MMFVDTSALYALADRADRNHRRAKELFKKALQNGEELWVHNYVLVEAAALLHHRLGFVPARKFLHDASAFRIVWIDAPLHETGAAYFSRRGKKISFVDCVSFMLMQQSGIATAFAFDEDFMKAGFKLYS